jgi:succinyl-CoA synthetase alpha subunit
MSILLDRTNRVLVQGISGQMATFSTADMRAYGTQIVGGVAPGRGGDIDGVPLFPDVRTACRETGADTSIAYIPPAAALSGVLEALECGCKLVVFPADEVPVQDGIELRAAAKANGAVLIGPNTPGIISPGEAKLGFMPSFCYAKGSVGVISRSGSLSYEISEQLTRAGLGQSTVVGIGGDRIKGFTAAEALEAFHQDPATDAILFLGEIGVGEEYAVATYASRSDAKPVAAFIVGRAAPPGKRMGHAGALVGSAGESYAAKMAALVEAGVQFAERLGDVVPAVRESLGRMRGGAARHQQALAS